MKKKLKKTLLISLIIMLLIGTSFPFPKIKFESHKKHVHKKHKSDTEKIIPIDTLEMERNIHKYKLFSREQIIKKQRLDAKKYKEKQEKIKRENERKRKIKHDNEIDRPYIIKDIVVTAYCTSGTTANGTQTREGYTLAAPPEYDFGTKIDLGEGIGVRIVSDRGGLIKGNTFDLYMSSEKQAREFGRRTIKAKIYK